MEIDLECTNGKYAVILSDSKSAITAIHSRKILDVETIYESVLSCNSKNIGVAIQWCPIYCVIQGNNTADLMAKDAAFLDHCTRNTGHI